MAKESPKVASTGSTLRLTGSALALTSRAFLLALGPLPAVQLSKGLSRLLQFGDEELNVVQQVVQDLLPGETDDSVGRASQWAEPLSGWSQAADLCQAHHVSVHTCGRHFRWPHLLLYSPRLFIWSMRQDISCSLELYLSISEQ